MPTFTATYDAGDNKLRLYADERLPPDLYARVRATGYAWAPKQGLFVAPMWTPEREDLALELAGEIEDEDRTLLDRAEDRAERFETYAEKRAADAERARAGVARIADGIPFGQPILVGHHSERHARKDAERIQRGMERAIKAFETSEYWERRARGSIHHAKYKEAPDVRARRIKGLEADERKHLKDKGNAEKFTAAWLRLDDPTFLKMKTGADSTPLQKAIYLAGCDSCARLSRLDLNEGNTTPEAAQVEALGKHARTLAHCNRWLAHLGNRLTYERTMLGESGYVPPPKPTSRAVLPILNYSGSVSYFNTYGFRGEVATEEATPITKAVLAAIGSDYKGTRVSACGTHRVRFALLRLPGDTCPTGRIVFVTDSKQHPRPSTEATAAGEAKAEAERQAAAEMRADASSERLQASAARVAERAAKAAPFDAMKASLAGGVQVVVAEQLFETPRPLAARMAELAEIEPWHTVLEPSAGTGRIVEAIKATEPAAHLDMIEINPTLCDLLRAKYKLTYSELAPFDFLTVQGPICPDSEKGFDRILMNPPFRDAIDIKHIEHALTFLKPGGRLVAICAGGSRQEKALKARSSYWERLPSGTFHESGTEVASVLLIINKGE
jgi:methylase of polypeptide subunit release factors